MFKKYYSLTKPGIIYGNAITATAGFLLASRGEVNFLLYLALILGVSLSIASGCVFNNFIDREIDAKMDRTKNRALAKGSVPVSFALIYGTLLGIFGLSILFFFVNLLVFLIGVFGFISYVILYGFFKRRTIYGTMVGAVSGALPPVAGYCAVAGMLDTGAFLLFLILAFWQMAHFYSIAIYRFDDYKSANLPMLPVVKGISLGKQHILFYIFAFIITASFLTFFNYTGYIFLSAIVLAGIYWLRLSLKGFNKNINNAKWAQEMFRFSLIALLVFSITVSLDVV